jgi:serine/threonine-protein kinase/endoribonuclease IRE1
VNTFRKYDFHSIKDLIRLIRNKVNHFHEIPKDIRNNVGKTPEAFI